MNRDFKGIWIPKEIYLDNRLNALDKIILAEIDSLDKGNSGCYASNEYISQFCKCSVSKVSSSIQKLIQLKYLELAKFDGRVRFLKSRLTNFGRQTIENKEAGYQNLEDININNSINDNINEINEACEYDWINDKEV